MFKDFRKWSIYRILKDDSVYTDVFNTRIAMLELYRSGLSAGNLIEGNLKRGVNRSISLTKECRLVAEDLRNGCIRLEKIFPTETEQAIDQLIGFQMKAASQNNNYDIKIPKQLKDIALASQREDYKIAKQIMLESKKTKKPLRDVLGSKFPDSSSTEYYSVNTTIELLVLNYEAYMTGVDSGKSLIEVAELFRGLFYMGIVDYQGSELDEEQLGKDLKDFAVEAVGIFAPQYASLVSLGKMISKTVDVIMNLHNAQLPSIIKEAQKLESFLHRYKESLSVWKSTAKFMITRLDSLGRAIKQYQVN